MGEFRKLSAIVSVKNKQTNKHLNSDIHKSVIQHTSYCEKVLKGDSMCEVYFVAKSLNEDN